MPDQVWHDEDESGHDGDDVDRRQPGMTGTRGGHDGDGAGMTGMGTLQETAD